MSRRPAASNRRGRSPGRRPLPLLLTALLVAGLGVTAVRAAGAAPGRQHIIESATEDFLGVNMGEGCKGGRQSLTTVSSPVRAGAVAFRHHVEPCGERAEGQFSKTRIGETYWLGWSTYLPADFDPAGHFTIMAQWAAWPLRPGRQPLPCGGAGHMILAGSDGSLRYALHAAGPGGTRCTSYPLGSVGDVKGRWVDMVQQMKVTGDGDGFMKLWMQVGGGGYKQVIDHRGPTYWNDEGEGFYFKNGVYTGEPGWKGRPATVFTDEYRLGSSAARFADVAPGDGGGSPPEPGPSGSPTSSGTPTPPPAGGAVREDFSADGAAGSFRTSGGSWAVAGGGYRLSRPAGRETGNANIAVHRTVVGPDLVVSATLRADRSGTGWSDTSLVFGYRGPGDYFSLSLNERNDDDTSGLFRVRDGVATQLADVAEPMPADTAHAARVEVTGTRIRASVDGRQVAEAEAEVPAGQVGFGTRNNGAVFDDLVAGPGGPSSPAPEPTTSPTAAPPGGGGPRCAGDLLDADFEGGDLSEFDGKEALEQELRVVPDPAGGAGKSMRIEVRNGDYGRGGSRDRAEVTQEGAGGANQDRDRCFAFRTYVPADWDPEKPSMLFQVHERPSACEAWRSPPLFLVVDGTRMSWGTRWDSKACSKGNVAEGTHGISSSPLVRGRWVSWEVKVHWSYRSDGLVEVWQDGRQVGRHRGPNSYNDDREMYLKIGNYVYSGFGSVDRHVSYVDDVRMGT